VGEFNGTRQIADGDRPIVVLSTYYDPKYYNGNKYTTLPIRYQVIEEGVKQGLVDVHGKGWEKHPFVLCVDNSRNDPDRRESKSDVLKQYKFNICLENVDYPYYITEKIWESIKWGCLPIYYSNHTIYESLPRNSFIDIREYEDKYGLKEGIKKMYEDIKGMSDEEYQIRYGECLRGFNKIVEEGKNNVARLKSENPNINYVEYKSCYDTLLKKIREI
jgi:hypothetical protein